MTQLVRGAWTTPRFAIRAPRRSPAPARSGRWRLASYSVSLSRDRLFLFSTRCRFSTRHGLHIHSQQVIHRARDDHG